MRRAVETARAVVEAQHRLVGAEGDAAPEGDATVVTPTRVAAVVTPEGDAAGADTPPPPPVKLVQLVELRERDFGKAEGKTFAEGRGLEGAESRGQMRARAEGFVEGHLVPVLRGGGSVVVVVAHGLILESLLTVLLARFVSGGVGVLGDARMGGWANTGYAELAVEVGSGDLDVPHGVGDGVEVSGERTPRLNQPRVAMSVVGLNVLTHLEGLKKTRGGIGSAQFDKRQRTMDSFFGPAAKKARVDKNPDESEA